MAISGGEPEGRDTLGSLEAEVEAAEYLEQTFLLSVPPSTNALYMTDRKANRRFKTPKYTKWQTQAGWELMGQKPRPTQGDVTVEIRVAEEEVIFKNGSKKRDLDNMLKALLDLLVLHRVIEDDRYIKKLSIERWESKDLSGVSGTVLGKRNRGLR